MSCSIVIAGQLDGPYSGKPKLAQGYINGGGPIARGTGATMGLGIKHFTFSNPSSGNRGNSIMSLSSRRFRIFFMEKEFLLRD